MSESPFIITHPTHRDSGDEEPHALTIHFGTRVGEIGEKPSQPGQPSPFLIQLMTTDGIDALEPIGVYTVSARIGKCFDPVEVKAAITEVIERALSPLSLPPSGSGKILTLGSE